MKLFFTITKKGLAVALAVISVVFLTSVWTFSLKAQKPDGSTHEKRMLYVKSLKVSVKEDEITSKETVIPENFGKVYSNYNKIQKQSGFDLSKYKGKTVTVYSCPLVGGEKMLTLIVFNGEIIGGDIADISVNGNMFPLAKAFKLEPALKGGF